MSKGSSYIHKWGERELGGVVDHDQDEVMPRGGLQQGYPWLPLEGHVDDGEWNPWAPDILLRGSKLTSHTAVKVVLNCSP